MAITFDAANKRIILDSANVSATEIYSRWVDWAATGDNAKYGMVIRQVGSDDLGGGLVIPPYFFLQGSWRVRPMESSHTLIITGNLFVEGGGIPVVQTLGNYNVSVQYTVPVQAQGFDSGGGASVDYTAIANAVWTHSTATDMATRILIMMKLLRNKTITDPGTGIMTVFEDDGTTPFMTCSIFENAGGTQPYRGEGVENRGRFA